MIYYYRITTGMLEEKLHSGYIEAQETQEAVNKLFDILHLDTSPNSIVVTEAGNHISIS